MKGQTTIVLTIATLIIAGIISFSILDAVTKPTMRIYGVTNESHTYSAGTLITSTYDNIVSASDSVTNAAGNCTLTRDTNYTITIGTGTWNVSDYDDTNCSTSLYFSYNYYPDEYLNSSLSRTITTYIVPLGLLGLLAAVAVMKIF